MATPEIGDAIEASDSFIMDEMEYRKYLQRESAIWDYNNDIIGSQQIGFDRGYEQKTYEMIDGLLDQGVDISIIAKASKWSVPKVEAYAAKRKRG
ncbi:hypothetical protein [uncultured Selenomonas sp.]|uniref:hypothetical protein n=1 Tax=uncultured Selenomonas sp. TaxID=159275 RepID=UPI0025EDC4FD|nr:hypothetical protein [uncultured Selenomonas sp.]